MEEEKKSRKIDTDIIFMKVIEYLDIDDRARCERVSKS